MAKQPAAGLAPHTKPAAKEAAVTALKGESKRGSVQTVRMNDTEVRMLKLASIDRRVSQQDIMLRAIRLDLGLKAERQADEL